MTEPILELEFEKAERYKKQFEEAVEMLAENTVKHQKELAESDQKHRSELAKNNQRHQSELAKKQEQIDALQREIERLKQ